MTVDMLKQQINIGDTVVYNPPHYKGINTGKVLSFTPKQVKIKDADGTEIKRFSSEVVVINDQIKAAKEKYPEHYI